MMKDFVAHLRSYVFRGLLAIIPLALCALAIKLLYVLIDKRIMVFLAQFFEVRQIPGLGILLLLISLYLIGVVVSNIIGKQFFKFIEEISRRIPLIKAIYGIGQQLSQSLSLADTEKQAFKKAVLVKINDTGLMVPAFVMGSMTNRGTNEEFLFILVPTAPTPASGFVVVVRSSETVDPGWTVEECLKIIVSGGIVSPKETKI